MGEYHSSFAKPDDNTVIWRYMGFLKFISLLERQALFFSNITLLRQSDNHEGTYNNATVKSYEQQQPTSILHHMGSGLLREFSSLIAVNCWHMSEIESTGMWDVYLNGSYGVAIQSTVARLENAIQKSNNNTLQNAVFIGKVNYLGEDEPIPEPDGFNGLNAVMWKRDSYRYENELRAVAIVMPEQSYKYNGIYVPAKLEELIQQIVISPKAPRWYSELIHSIVEKYELADVVISSRLDESPGNIDDTKLSLSWTCLECKTSQKVAIEPFIIRELTDNSTILFSPDRMQVQCQNCSKPHLIELKKAVENHG